MAIFFYQIIPVVKKCGMGIKICPRNPAKPPDGIIIKLRLARPAIGKRVAIAVDLFTIAKTLTRLPLEFSAYVTLFTSHSHCRKVTGAEFLSTNYPLDLKQTSSLHRMAPFLSYSQQYFRDHQIPAVRLESSL